MRGAGGEDGMHGVWDADGLRLVLAGIIPLGTVMSGRKGSVLLKAVIQVSHIPAPLARLL